MDFNYERSGQKRDNFFVRGRGSKIVTSQHEYNRESFRGPGLDSYRYSDQEERLRYNRDFIPPVAPVLQTPETTYNRNRFQTPFMFHNESVTPTVYHDVSLESPEICYETRTQYDWSPKTMAVHPSTSHFSKKKSNFVEGVMKSDSHDHTHFGMHSKPVEEYLPSKKSFGKHSLDPSYLPQFKRVESACNLPFRSDNSMQADENEFDTKTMWQQVNKSVNARDTQNRIYGAHESNNWNNMDENTQYSLKYNQCLSVGTRMVEEQDQQKRKQTISMLNDSKAMTVDTKKYNKSNVLNNKGKTTSPAPIEMMKAQPNPSVLQQNKNTLPANDFRILTGTLKHMMEWEKKKEKIPALLEVIASFVVESAGYMKGDKVIILREASCPALKCFFQEVDRPLPNFQPGQLVRCVGKMQSMNTMRVYSIRAAQASEKANLHRLYFISNRAIQCLEENEPLV